MKYANQHIENAKNFWNQSLRRAAGALGVSLLLVASASSQVASTGPFSGQYHEDFEVDLLALFLHVPNPVLQGGAQYSTYLAEQHPHWAYGSCTTSPHGGAKLAGDIGGSMWFDFNAAPTRFGGYFGSNQPGGPAVGNVRFLSASSTLIATDVITLQNNCSWQWVGWNILSSNVRRIEFSYSGYVQHVMMDDLELDLAPVVNSCFETFCFGDFELTPGQCPCGNALPLNTTSGCANSTGAGGRLAGLGNCSASANGASLIAENLIPNQWALFFEGSSAFSGGGVPFADGLLCVGGPYAGIKFVKVDAVGVAGPVEDLWYSGLGWEVHLPGDTSYYQCFYKDPISSACGTTWNLTNGVKVNWTP